jgi:hypothetical protein
LTHWLKRVDAADGAPLALRHVAAIPVTPGEAQLPEPVAVSALDLHVTAEGPIAHVAAAFAITNTGDEPQSVELGMSGAVLPVPLVASGTERVVLEPGGTHEFRLSAICLLVERDGHYVLGMNPESWTSRRIGRLLFSVDASAENGLRGFSCPAQQYHVRKADRLDWSWTDEDVAPSAPLVVEFEANDRGSVDVLGVETGSERRALVAWKWRPVKEPWIRKGTRLLASFDATADFGAVGRPYAHGVMETLLSAIPPAVPAALVAHDGDLHLDSQPWTLHMPHRAESMLAFLWGLEAPGDARRPSGLLASALKLASGGEDARLLVHVTGRASGEEAGSIEALSAEEGVRVAVLQVGADRVSECYRRLCARSGGAAIALPVCTDATMAAADFVESLRGPAAHEIRLRADGEAVILQKGGVPSNTPVVAVVRLAPGQNSLAGTFEARVGSKSRRREFSRELSGVVTVREPWAVELDALGEQGMAH